MNETFITAFTTPQSCQFTHPPHGDIVFYKVGNIEFMRLTANGEIKISSNILPDEAAYQFLSALEKIFPQWINNPNQHRCTSDPMKLDRCVSCGRHVDDV